MTVSVKHATQAVGTDAGTGEIRKTQWNEEHDIQLASGHLLGRTTAGSGAAEEVPLASDAQVHSGASGTVLTSDKVYSAHAPVTSSGSGSWAPDMQAGRVFSRTLTGNSTLANPVNQVAGQCGVFYFAQDATGGWTLSFGSNFKIAGGAPTAPNGIGALFGFSYYVVAAGDIRLLYLGEFV